jgi:uncharacterized protein YegJ (DUF2314 family)
MRTLAIAVILVAVSACQPRDPNIREFAADDPEMTAAIDSARASDSVLIRHLSMRPAPASRSYLSVKLRFTGMGNGEHIWLDSVRFDGELFHGQLDDDGVIVPGLRRGNWVSGSRSELSDWMIVDSGRVCGGFTMRVARRHAPEPDRAVLDSGLVSLGVTRPGFADRC